MNLEMMVVIAKAAGFIAYMLLEWYLGRSKKIEAASVIDLLIRLLQGLKKNVS